MANKEFDNVQLFAEYDSTVGSSVVNVFGNKSKENIAYSLSKIKNWFPWLVPTNGSAGQILEWYNNVPTWRVNTNADTVKQTHSTDTDFHPLVLGAPHSASAWGGAISETTDQVYMNKGIYVKPSTSTIYASDYRGKINGFSLIGTEGSTYNLDAFITSQFISSITTTGNGNGVTAIGVNNGVMTVTKGSTFALDGHTHPLSIATDTGDSQLSMSANTKYKLTAGGSTFIFTTPQDSDTKVTSSTNHYTPATASGQDKTASASGATAAWSIDVVKGVTLNTDGKGHVTGISVTSGKIPGNPNTDRYVNTASFADDSTNTATSPVKMTLTRAGSDTATVTANIPKVSSTSAGVAPKGAAVSSQSQSTKFLREDGSWAAPSYTSIPSNNVTGSGTSGYLTKWSGTNTITNGPQLGSSTTTFLRNDGTWATPPVGEHTHAYTVPVGITIKTGSSDQSHITLQTLMSWLITTKGYITSNTARSLSLYTSWNYAGNDILQLTIDGTAYELQLAGVIIEFDGYASDYQTGTFRLRIHSSPTVSFTPASGYTQFPASHIAEYTCNGSGYSPTWKMLVDKGDTVTRTGGGASGTWGISISGNAATSTSTSALSRIDGYGTYSLTYHQADDDFGGTDGRGGNSGTSYWAHYIVANHGNGESYYHYTLRLPFWGTPQYQRQTGSTSSRTRWMNFLTEETGAAKPNYCAFPADGYYSASTSTVTGAMVITLPIGFSAIMLQFTVEIFNYITNKSCMYRISGYLYDVDSKWYNVTATCISGYGYDSSVGRAHNLKVRFGRNSTSGKAQVQIGETTTQWAWPGVQIRDVLMTHGTVQFDTISQGWSIAFQSSANIDNISNTVDSDYVATYANVLKPFAGNEINFSDLGQYSNIWFGYRMLDPSGVRPTYSSAPIKSYNFGNGIVDGNTSNLADIYAKTIYARDGSVYAGYQGGGDNVLPSYGYHIYDLRNATVTPAMADHCVQFYFSNAGTPDNRWWSVIHVRGWNGSYNTWQLAGPAHNTDQRTTPLYVRSSNTSSTWGSWRKIYDSSNVPTASELGFGTIVTHAEGDYIPNTKAGLNTAINLLDTGSSTPTDADYYISQYVGGGTTTTTYHRRPMSALWSYVKGKADSVYIPLSAIDISNTTNLGLDGSKNAFGYISGLTKATWNYQQTDGFILRHFYNASWKFELYADYRTGKMSVRGKNNGTWQSWRRIPTVVEVTNAKSATRSILHLAGPTYGNDAANMISGTTGLFSYGDGGPQITFCTTENNDAGGQDSALIWTDNDGADPSATTGVSWHFVSKEADWNVTSKRFHARTAITIGTDKPVANSYNLYVTGNGYFSTGITSAGFSTTGTNKGYRAYDQAGTQYAIIYDNGSNLWVGAEASTVYHHKGSTFISSGWTGTLPTAASQTLTGNSTIYVSVPKYTTNAQSQGSWNHTQYPVLHSGNYTDYTVTKTGTGASGTWGISISGSAEKLGTANKGSATKGIYLSGGTPQEMTYSLSSTVNSGTANCIAYYSGANAISSAAKVTYVNANNSASTPATVAGLHIESPTYGNTAANMIGGVAGVFSYGDGGPQIRFKDGSSTQAGALIFTADDAAATGTSWHFVSNETDWNVTSKRFHAKTSISIGTDKPSTSYNLTVNGTSYFDNTITIKGTSSGNASINYASYGNTRNYTSIKFYDGDANGQGVQVGGGGLTVIGGGESAQTVFDNLSTLGLTTSSEAAVIASDGPIYFYTNVDTGIANRKAVSINTSGYLNTGYINMATSDEDNNFSSSSAIIYSNSDKYLRRTTFSKLASLLQTETMVYDGHVIHQNDYNSAGFTRPVHRFIRDLRPNKLAFTLPANITMEYSTNAGSSWTSFGYTDAEKAGPFISRHTGGYIAIGPTSGERTTSMQTRITITNDGRDCFIDQFYIWMSTSGHGTTVDIQYSTQSAKTTWVDWRMGVGLGGWAGPNIINVSELRYGNTIYSIRFTFKITSVHASYKTQPGTIYDIQAYGAMACWTSKNNMMMHDSLFTWDYGQNATFPANVSATKFIGPLQGNADTATTATKLGTSTVGSGSRPIYLNAGTPTQCDTPTSGAWWNGVPGVASNGVMEIGKYIDFHASNTTTMDYDYRITAESQVLHFSPKSSGDATYNLLQLESPEYNQIRFYTSKSGKAYTSTGIVAYPLTTSGQTMLIQSDGNLAIGGGESPRTLYSNSYDNMDTAENETLYLASDSSEIHLITNCQAYSGRKILKVQDGQLTKSGGQWIFARDVAPVYANKPNTQDDGYYPAWFAKTKSGGWSMGVLSAHDNLYITYTSDTDYSGGSNTNTYQVQFQNKSGTVALTSDIPSLSGYLPLSGGTMTGVLTAKGSMYEDAYNGALNMNNSDIYGLNSIYTADPSDGAAEGIHFYRDTTHVDTLWMSGGSLLFVPNRELGTSTTAANSQKVARFTANPTSGQIVVTDGTTGGVKTTGYTTSSFLSSSTKYAGSDTVGGVANNSYYLGDSTTPSTYKLRYINSNDVTTWTTSSLAATDSIAVIRGSVTDAWTTGHIVTFNVASVGTPFQLGIHDSSELYFYKRYKTGSTTWSGWTKMNAGNADSATYVKVIGKNEIRFLNESGQFDYTSPSPFWIGYTWAPGSISGTHLISTYIMGNCSASGSGDNIASVTAKGFVSKTTSGGAGCTMQYNSSTQSLEFVFS